MNELLVDVTNHEQIAALGQRVLAGGAISREEARWLFNLESTADIFDLLSWANRIRERFKGNKIHLCSIVNAKAGACSENCRFCSQSSLLSDRLTQIRLRGPRTGAGSRRRSQSNGVTAVGLVAAWKGLNEGPDAG